MNDSDYAIVVGISRYPGFGTTPTDNANLQAPVRDANDIREWLVSSDGGHLPPQNVELICSDEGPEAPIDVLKAVPKLQEIQDAFHKLVRIAEDSDSTGDGFHTGRRLYIYMSGHGFAPSTYTSSLFVANATRLNVPNLYASGWLQWFQDAACFEEFVLWMDCCMDRLVTVEPEAISLRPRVVPRPRAPAMIAFAATRSLRALEANINGAVHSVFTHTLLKGLNGAARDKQTGRVTGSSLGDYLFNAMKDWIPAAEMKNPLIAKEPNIIKADADLILVESQQAGFAPEKYPITIRFADLPQPAPARLWQGSPPRAEALDVADGVATIGVPRGLYVVEVPGQNLRKGFEVTGSGPVEVSIGPSDGGDPVNEPPPEHRYRLDIRPAAAYEIFVLDADFKLVGRGRGGALDDNQLMPFGIYKVKTRLGREFNEKIILLDSDNPVELGDSARLGAPVLLSKEGLAADPDLPDPDNVLEQIHVYAGEGAEILLMVRDEPPLAAGPGAAVIPGATIPYGARLLDSTGKLIADLDVHGVRRHPGEDIGGHRVTTSLACCRVALAPGVYYLQRALSGGILQEQTVLAIAGFRTELHEVRSRLAPTAGEDIVHQQVMVMSDLQAPALEQQGQQDAGLIEAATVALADHRKILTDHLRARLVTGFKDPIAGLLGGHLLLIEAESNPAFDPADGLPALDDVVTRLRKLVKDKHLPDIEALSQCCANRDLRGKMPLQYPPVFSRSWKIAVAACRNNPGFVPAELWGRVHAKLSATPYFTWAADAKSRQAHADSLVAQMFAAMKAPKAPAELRLPATMPEALASLPSASMPSRSPSPVARGPGAGTAGDDDHPSPEPGGAAVMVASEELVSRLASQWSIPADALDRLLAEKAPDVHPAASRASP